MKHTIKRRYKRKQPSKKKRHFKKIGGKMIPKNPSDIQPIPLPNIPPPINPVIINDETPLDLNILNGGRKHKKTKRRKFKGIRSKTYKGGFKADIVDNLEDRDDDWIITKQ